MSEESDCEMSGSLSQYIRHRRSVSYYYGSRGGSQWSFGRCHRTETDLLCVLSEDEEEDEEVTEPKDGPETDLQEEEESKETKEGKSGSDCTCLIAEGEQK